MYEVFEAQFIKLKSSRLDTGPSAEGFKYAVAAALCRSQDLTCSGALRAETRSRGAYDVDRHLRDADLASLSNTITAGPTGPCRHRSSTRNRALLVSFEPRRTPGLVASAAARKDNSRPVADSGKRRSTL